MADGKPLAVRKTDVLPFPVGDEAALESALSEPDERTIDALASCPGDLLVLGAGGKMGPTLARMARRAFDAGGRKSRVIAVSRWTSEDARRSLAEHGVETMRADLTDPAELAGLPDAANVIFMAGQKFGTRDDPSLTWLLNAVAPMQCAQRFRGARTVLFSTGNVYPLVIASGDGSSESDMLVPVGEYAASCVARERLYALAAGPETPVAVVRLNYAVDLRYGVLVDLARRVLAEEPIDVTMGWVNVIWQGDANRFALAALAHASSPAAVFNITGPERLSVRGQATELGRLLDRTPVIRGEESTTALLSNVQRMLDKLGKPSVPASRLLAWTAQWVQGGGHMLGKPTHFEVRDGAF